MANLMAKLFSLPLALLCSIVLGSDHQEWHEFLIIGAGPGGLQMGYYFEKFGVDYLVVERSAHAGSFFNTYPRHRKLISINKRFVGSDHPDFAMRHDWNSLLNDEGILFTKYSEDYFPHSDALVDYLRDFSALLNIKYNTNVDRIETGPRDGKTNYLLSTPDGVIGARVLIVATGMAVPHIPPIPGIELATGYEDMDLNPRAYRNHSTLILGAGNTAFEIANNITGEVGDLVLMSRNRHKFAWQTHYVGDLRAVNNELLDTYQLKSLTALVKFDIAKKHAIVREVESGKLILAMREPGSDENTRAHSTGLKRFKFDTIIRATGFAFNMTPFTEDTKPRITTKHPDVTAYFESETAPDMFFAGAAMHGRDYRKSSGGFIHGFRYLIRTLFHYLSSRYHSIGWRMSQTFPLLSPEHLAHEIQARIQHASGEYQMFGVLCDFVVVRAKTFTIYHEMSLEWSVEEKLRLIPANETDHATGFYTWHFDYGADFKSGEADVFRNNNCIFAECADFSQFLHPIVNYYNAEHKHVKTMHLVEDVKTTFDLELEHTWALAEFVRVMESGRVDSSEPWYGDPEKRKMEVRRRNNNVGNDRDRANHSGNDRDRANHSGGDRDRANHSGGDRDRASRGRERSATESDPEFSDGGGRRDRGKRFLQERAAREGNAMPSTCTGECPPDGANVQCATALDFADEMVGVTPFVGGAPQKDQVVSYSAPIPPTANKPSKPPQQNHQPVLERLKRVAAELKG